MEALDSILANQVGPQIYLQSYENLSYILDGGAAKSLDEYFQNDPLPSLRDFGHKIESYDALSKEICLYRNKVEFCSSLFNKKVNLKD